MDDLTEKMDEQLSSKSMRQHVSKLIEHKNLIIKKTVYCMQYAVFIFN